jgi:hypothetical protein
VKNNKAMATVTIDERTSKGKSLLEFLRKFEGDNFIQIEKEPNAETKRARSDVKKGKVTRTKNVADLMDKLND